MRLISFAVLLLALTRVSWAAGANEDAAPRPDGGDSAVSYSQQSAPLHFRSALPRLGFLQLGGTLLDSVPPGPDNPAGRPQGAPRAGTGFFAVHEPKHKPAGSEPAGEEDDDEGISLWFGAEIVLMLLGSDGDGDVSGEGDSDLEPSELADDGVMFGFNLSFGFGERESYGLGLVVESGILSADLAVAGVDGLISVNGDYTLAGPSLRFGGKNGHVSLDLLFGDMTDPQVSSLFNFRANFRFGVGPVSSGFHLGLSLGLLYIGFDEEVDSIFSGNVNLLWGLGLGGQF